METARESHNSNYRPLLTVQHSYYQYTYDLQETAEFFRRFDDLIAHWREHLLADRLNLVKAHDMRFAAFLIHA